MWGTLWSCFYHLETWQEENPGEMVESVHAVSSSDGSRAFSCILSGWEGLGTWWPSILLPFLAVASQGEMAAWN